MFIKTSYVITMVVLCQYHAPSKAQVFGGVSSLPGGGSTQQAGYKAGPASGSLSQSSNHQGMTNPITYSGDINAISQQGSGVSGSLAMQPGIGGQGSVGGIIGLFNTGFNAFAQHDRYLDKDLRPVGPETNSAGVKYSSQTGASAFAQGSQTNGQPAHGTVGASVPLYTSENAQISATGQTTFGHGMKPQSQVEIEGNLSF